MRLRKKSSTIGRQRVRSPESSSPRSFGNHSRRSESSSQNTSRQPGRALLPPLSGATGSYWLRRTGLLVLLCVGVVSAVNIIVLKPTANVLPLQKGGQHFLLHDTSAYTAAANKILASSVWNRTKLTVNTASVNQKLTTQFPELAKVQTVLPLLGHRPIVYIETAQPVLILRATNGDYVLDNRGKALLKAADLPANNSLRLPVIDDLSGLRVTLNRQIITPGDVRFIQIVVAQLASRQFTVSSLTLPPAASELDVHLAGQPYIVKFNLQMSDAREQAGTFLATANYLKQHNAVPGEYVDVRVDGRAYYK
jgi:hypothetical protein